MIIKEWCIYKSDLEGKFYKVYGCICVVVKEGCVKEFLVKDGIEKYFKCKK